jgi:hypothetical protein
VARYRTQAITGVGGDALARQYRFIGPACFDRVRVEWCDASDRCAQSPLVPGVNLGAYRGGAVVSFWPQASDAGALVSAGAYLGFFKWDAMVGRQFAWGVRIDPMVVGALERDATRLGVAMA